MDRNPSQLRIARLQCECDVSCVPPLLLLAACSTLVAVLAFGDLRREEPERQAEQQTMRQMPSAA